MNHLRVLVINGVGVRGIVPARLLQEIEDLSGKHITDLFDYIIGTSIGGIEAIALTVPGADGKPKYSPKDIVDILLNDAQVIFPHNPSFPLGDFKDYILGGIVTSAFTLGTIGALTGAGLITGLIGGGIFGAIATSSYYAYEEGFLSAKYSREGIDNLLEKKFGNTTLNETVIPISTVSYSLDKQAPKIWSTFKAQFCPEKYNYYVKDAAGATSATPTYFPYKTTIAPDGTIRHDIDGGIFANSPTFLGISELLEYERSLDVNKLIVFSIGTGKVTNKAFDFDNLQSLGDGKLGWVSSDSNDLIGMMMKGTEFADAIESRYIFNAMRLNIKLEHKFASLDMSAPEYMHELLSAVETTFIADHRGMLEQIVSCLESKNIRSIPCVQARSAVKEYAPEDFQYDNLYLFDLYGSYD